MGFLSARDARDWRVKNFEKKAFKSEHFPLEVVGKIYSGTNSNDLR
jgi:hypothetical protein